MDFDPLTEAPMLLSLPKPSQAIRCWPDTRHPCQTLHTIENIFATDDSDIVEAPPSIPIDQCFKVMSNGDTDNFPFTMETYM